MTDRYQLRPVQVVIVIAIALAAAFLVWYFAIRDTESDDGGARPAGPVAATRADIADLARRNNHPVYWAGNQPKTTDLELTQAGDGNIFVRYLTGNAPIDTPNPAYLTVGTYPFSAALHAVRVIAREPGANAYDLPSGGLAVQNSHSPSSVYLAYPGENFQIEVYDPNPATALRLVKAGDSERVR